MDNKPIYLQLAESLVDRIFAGEYPEGMRLPSVREYAAQQQVNVNTAVRSYAFLQENGLAVQERGLGYFVAEGAREAIRRMRSRDFFCDEIYYFFRRLQELDVTPEALAKLYDEYLQNNA